jgi:alkanesulfonate monooxygenase SsuD/methylene tetrahydromethanopterin reductase-like flavin-dependent oxidoreductase (luciferase family)
VRFCIDVPNFGRWANPRAFAEFARGVEDAGWDGISVWDHIAVEDGWDVADPWVMLAAAAMVTDRIRLMTLVTPIPRRHPWKLARECVSLDLLSGGRLILGVGSGALGPELTMFHGEEDPRRRADMLDEGLQIVTGLWTGEPYEFHGTHYEVESVTFRPTPVQQPRIPIWVAATWPSRRPMRRAAKWDGVAPIFFSSEEQRDVEPTPGMVRELADYAAVHRTADSPLDIAVGFDLRRVDEFAEAGVTWCRHGWDPEAGIEHEDWISAVFSGPPA